MQKKSLLATVIASVFSSSRLPLTAFTQLLLRAKAARFPFL